LTITLKVVNKFPSNLAHKCLTMWHKYYPLHLMYVRYSHYLLRVKLVTKRSVILHYC